MPVLSSSKGSWECLSCSVDGLPNILHVDSASDFSDEDGGDTFFTEFFVTAKEVDLSHHDGLALDDHLYRDSRDEGI